MMHASHHHVPHAALWRNSAARWQQQAEHKMRITCATLRRVASALLEQSSPRQPVPCTTPCAKPYSRFGRCIWLSRTTLRCH
eukprot:5705339-Amphidinium_carterae.3